MELSARERADLAYKAEVYRLAVARKATAEGAAEEGYRLPDSYDEPAKRDERMQARARAGPGWKGCRGRS